MKKIIFFTFLTIAFFAVTANTAFAHQPRLVESEATEVVDPEVSKAYYGELIGSPHVYTIESAENFELYVGILMPYAMDSKKDVQAEIRKGDETLDVVGGSNASWEKMFEFFGQSNYWDGGDYRANVDGGKYIIIVSSADNTGKYSLAVGNIESFNGKEIASALQIIPRLKRDFFKESPISLIKSPFGWGYILVMYILAFIAGFLYRLALRKLAKNAIRKKRHNIGFADRMIRLAIGIGLLIWAITTLWSPWLLFISGFVVFEAVFSWCGLYAAIGKNTCPI